MSDNQSNNKRLAKNTMFMYIRMLVLLFIGLYTSRVILSSLGVSDYGLYNVVGGVVTLFAFLNGALSTGTQRFLNFELGRGDAEKVKAVFRTAFTQHLMLIGIVLLFAETIGLWFITNKLNIDEGRDNAAFWVYQTAIVSLCLQIVQLPFMSAIIAHEKMGFYAYFSIIEAVLKLAIAFSVALTISDKLIVYGFLVLGVQIITTMIYYLYSRISFAEARMSVGVDKAYFKDMLSFSGWNLFGGFCTISNNQGVNIVMNMFFGTVINAARGISFQVNSIITQFVTNFQVAVKPQVVKYYANGEIDKTIKLVVNTAKFSAFLMLVIVVPLVTEIDTVLTVWLGVYPENTPLFLSIVLIQSIFYSMVSATLILVHASGFVKKVGIYSGISYLVILPISYMMFHSGMPAYSVFIANVFAVLLDQFWELWWMNKYIGFSISKFYRDVYGRVVPVMGLSFCCSYIMEYVCGELNTFPRFFIVIPANMFITVGFIYWLGLERDMREFLVTKIKSFRYVSK